MEIGAHVITIGNEKGGSGKSTAAMHLIVALLQSGRSVASIDLDQRQGTLTRYIENRRAYAKRHDLSMPQPTHETVAPTADPRRSAAVEDEEDRLHAVLQRLARDRDVIVIDTAGGDTNLTRLGHSYADTLITPLNDSFIDLDVLARIDGESMKIGGPSHYAEMVWEQKIKRATRDGGSIDWIVMRNRLSTLDARNKRRMARSLHDLALRMGFRVIAGFGERVIYRELFLKGLTLMDLRQASGRLNLSHVAARQEVRSVVEAVGLPSVLVSDGSSE